MIAVQERALTDLPPGGHVCWVVDDPARYARVAADLLGDGAATGQKTVAFGPGGGGLLGALAAGADLAADPRVAFLGGGPLASEAMLAAFREHTGLARAQGFSGLRVVADMDWLLPAGPSSAEIAAFELQLDRVVRELGATVVCAYSRSSFDERALAGALCVHPIVAGVGEPPAFRLTAADDGAWALSGEVDLAVAEVFADALAVVGDHAPSVVDVSGLEFIDVTGMRAIAGASRDARAPIVLRGAPGWLRCAWRALRLDRDVPAVQLLPQP